MGLGERVSELLQEERVKETECMEKKNWLMVWVNVVGERSAFSVPSFAKFSRQYPVHVCPSGNFLSLRTADLYHGVKQPRHQQGIHELGSY